MSVKKRKPLPTHEQDELIPRPIEYPPVEHLHCFFPPFDRPHSQRGGAQKHLFPITSVVIFENEVVIHTLRYLTSYNRLTCIHNFVPNSYDKSIGGMDRIHPRCCFLNHKSEGKITVITVFSYQGLLEVLREDRFHHATIALAGILKSLRTSGHQWNHSNPLPESSLSSSSSSSSSASSSASSPLSKLWRERETP